MTRILLAQRLCIPCQVALISDRPEQATSMATIKHDHAAVLLETVITFNVMNSSGVCHTRRVDYHRKVDGHDAARTVQCIVTERLGRGLAVCLVYITQRTVGIYYLMHSAQNFSSAQSAKFKGWTSNVFPISSGMDGLPVRIVAEKKIPHGKCSWKRKMGKTERRRTKTKGKTKKNEKIKPNLKNDLRKRP